MCKIYIIVPIYNAEKYLQECLESISNQTYKNFICVMVDDGSSDNSHKICETFQENQNFILISQKNQGVAAARNTGLEYVFNHADDSDLLTFIDSDDFVDKTYLEKIADISNNTQSDKTSAAETMYFCGWNQLQENKILVHKQNIDSKIISGDFREDYELLDSFLQTLWANFYSIALIKEKKISFDKELTVNEDISFNFSYTYFVKKYVFINECLYNYREIPNSLSRTDLQAEWRVEMRFQSLKRRILFLNDCNIKNKQYVINKHISNMVSGSTLFSPFCRRLYQLKEYTDLKHVRSNGQRRVIFCLQHNLLWFYKFYMTIKHELFILKKIYILY